MTLFAFSLGVVLGAVGSALSIAVFVILEHGEDPLDSDEDLSQSYNGLPNS